MKMKSAATVLTAAIALSVLATLTVSAAATATGPRDYSDPSNWQLGETGIFNSIMYFFEDTSAKAYKRLLPTARYLIGIFGIINIAMTYMIYKGELRMSEMIGKILKIGAFMFIVNYGLQIGSAISDSFTYAGAVAAGMSVDSSATMKNFQPSTLLTQGWDNINEYSKQINGFMNPVDKFFSYITGWLAYFGLFLMAVQVMLTRVEFAIFVGLAAILLPFGLFKYTNFLAQRTISGVFSYGVKLLVVYFMIGLMTTIFTKMGTYAVADKLEWSKMLNFSFAYLIIGYLVWKIPNVIQGMMSGSPSLDGNSAGMGMIGGATAGAMWTARTYGSVRSTWARAKSRNGGAGGGFGEGGTPSSSDTVAGANANAGNVSSSSSGSSDSSSPEAGLITPATGRESAQVFSSVSDNNASSSALAAAPALAAKAGSGQSGSSGNAQSAEKTGNGEPAEDRNASAGSTEGGAKHSGIVGAVFGKAGEFAAAQMEKTKAGRVVMDNGGKIARSRVMNFLKLGTQQYLSNIGIVNAMRQGATNSINHKENWDNMMNGQWKITAEKTRNTYIGDSDKNN